MNRFFLILYLLVGVYTCLLGQSSVDFYPRSLKTELKKAFSKEVKLSEMTVPTELSSKIKNGRYFSVAELSALSLIKYIYVGRVNTCRAGGCNENDDVLGGDSEYFDYFILFDTTGSVVQVKIFNYQATHGHEVTASNWLKQFKNYNGNTSLVVGKDIDAISGATISVDATTYDIESRTRQLKKMLQ